MVRTLIIVLLIAQQWAWGQNLSKQKLIDDLQFLNEAVINGHPVNFHPQNKIDIQSTIDNARSTLKDSITPWEYTLWIEKGIYYIGCSHTSLKKNPLLTKTQKYSFIPLTASIQNHQLIITDCADSTKIGQHIEQINGVSSEEIIEAYKEYKASDGQSNAFALEYFSLASSKLIANYVGNPSQFKVKTSHEQFVLNGINSIYFKKKAPKTTQPLFTKNGNRLDTLRNFAILTIGAFNKSDKSFIQYTFKTIDKLKKDTLILDLRQNTGGNIKAAIALTQHLIFDTFSYSVLQPKLKTYRYLNSKGKKFFLLSKLKYNVGTVFRKKKNPLGNQYVYHFKPTTKNAFKGVIYVLTDGFTASSSTMITSWLKQHSKAVVMGSQACGGYNGNNGGSFPLITLPNSKIEIVFPAYRLILDENDNRNMGLSPDIPLHTSATLTEIISILRNK